MLAAKDAECVSDVGRHNDDKGSRVTATAVMTDIDGDGNYGSS